MRRLKVIFFHVILLLWAASCSTSEVEPESLDPGRDFYPIRIGNSWEYRVDTVDYKFSGDSTSGTYFRKEVIADSLFRQEGLQVYRLEIFRKSSPEKEWVLDSVWTIRPDPEKIIRTENNQPYVALRFPLREGSRWDGNAYNTRQDSNSVFWYTVRGLNRNREFRGESRPSVEIVQRRDSNCINKSEFSEVYMRNIGMIRKVRSFIQYSQEGTDPCGRIPRIEIGYKHTFTLTDFALRP